MCVIINKPPFICISSRKEKTKMKNYCIKLLSLILVITIMIPILVSCFEEDGIETPTEPPINTPADTPEETPADTGSEGTIAPDTTPETPADTGEIGDLVGEDPYKEPEKEKPETPRKPLFIKSSDGYGSGKYGCNGITVLSKYTDGLDFDIPAIKDSTNKIFCIYLPCRADISELYFEATHRDGSITGPYVANFADDEISDNERVIGGQNEYKIIVMQSTNPSVMIQIDETYGTISAMNKDSSHSTFAYGQMVTTVTDEMAKKNGWATRYVSVDENPDKYCSMNMRGRGNATWGYPKKPYQIKTENEMNLLGMEYSNTFILLANYRDAAGTRTQLALELGQSFGIDYSSDCVTVDLFLNGEYKGMYLLAEKVETGVGRVEIDLSEDVLYEVDNYAANEEFYGFQTSYINSATKGYRVHSAPGEPDPDLYDLSNDKDRKRYEVALMEAIDKAKELVKKAETALLSGNDTEFQKYFDVDSWARMYLLQLYTMNSDAYYGSFYFYYDATDGKFHTCSPWDFDWSLGMSWGAENMKNPNKYDIGGNPIIKEMLKYKSFIVAVVKAYYEGGCRDAMLKAPDRIAELGKENKLSAEMNAMVAAVTYYPTKDDKVSFYSGTVSNYDEAVEYLKFITQTRITWMDNKIKSYANTIGYKIPS